MNEPAQNLNQALLAAMESYADQTCFKVKKGGHYRNISYRRFRTLTFRMVRFLQDQGISNGERVAIASNNCLEWMVVYMATLLAGGVVVPLRASLAPDTLQFTLQDSGARLLVLDDEQRLRIISALINSDKGQLPELQSVLAINEIEQPGPATIPIADVLAETTPPTVERHVTQSSAPVTAARQWRPTWR